MQPELVTLVPPGTGGVRDYADIMAQRLDTRVIAITPETPLATYGEGDLLLNFSGYGYQMRGVPQWLVDRLRELRPRVHTIGIFFHELFAQEPPWRTAFWFAPIQRRIAANLATIADFWLTNNELAARWLQRHAKDVPHRVLPVYSNVGEPTDISGARAPRIVVFGGPANRITTYRQLDNGFWHWVQANKLSVHDIGPPIKDPAIEALAQSGRLVLHGALPAVEVSRHLREASYGLLRYPTHVAGKSGVLAAYCAHGLCPVLIAPDYHAHDGLHAMQHYVAGIDALKSGNFNPASLGMAAFQWYQPHCTQAHAQAVQDLLATARSRRAPA